MATKDFKLPEICTCLLTLTARLQAMFTECASVGLVECMREWMALARLMLSKNVRACLQSERPLLARRQIVLF
jgi:hypothetical protein